MSKGARTIADIERALQAGRVSFRSDMREIRRELSEIREFLRTDDPAPESAPQKRAAWRRVLEWIRG